MSEKGEDEVLSSVRACVCACVSSSASSSSPAIPLRRVHPSIMLAA